LTELGSLGKLAKPGLAKPFHFGIIETR